MKLMIGGTMFATKKKAKDFVIDLAKKYMGGRIDETSPDFCVFQDLWIRSPSHVNGMSHFEVGKRFSSVSIKTFLRDGKIIDWSLRNAVSGRFPNLHTQLTLAMRLAIRPQIQAFRYNNYMCVECGGQENIEIDHVKPFKELMREYMYVNETPEYYHFSPAGWAFTKNHAKYEAGWVEFHKLNSKLQALCAPCHKQVTLAALQRENSDEDSDEVALHLTELQPCAACTYPYNQESS